MKAELVLYWLDKNWGGRGYGLNFYLNVDIEAKEFSMCTTSYCVYNSDGNCIQVVRKSDILNFAKYLKSRGYVCIGKELS